MSNVECVYEQTAIINKLIIIYVFSC